ncbi:MAG TPA: transcriptional repressor [Candidatus Kapabacteria bacterium]|nr:transcriptional repressor [Candidatus Kapabacteria bacterium]
MTENSNGSKAQKRSKKNTSSDARENPHDVFRKFLHDGEYRNTPERFEVLDAVLSWDDHFDADNLFIYLKNAGSKVSRATVYKTLNLLHECGLVSRYRFSQGHAQYEKTTDRPHHDHLICTTCGKIIEFDNGRVVQMQNDICIAYGFKPLYHSFQIFSECLDGAMDIQDCEYARQRKLALMNPAKRGGRV